MKQVILITSAIVLFGYTASSQYLRTSGPYSQDDSLRSVISGTRSGMAYPPGYAMAQNLRPDAGPYPPQEPTHILLHGIDTAVVWHSEYGTQRFVNAFASGGKRTFQMRQRLTDGSWVDDWRATTIYDRNDSLISELGESFYNGQWGNSIHDTCTYDAQGRRLTWLVERWWDNGPWRNDRRYTYTYDADGNQLSESLDLWEQDQWVNAGKYTYTYNAADRRTSCLSEWSGINYDRTTYSYDGDGNVVRSMLEFWTLDRWDTSSRESYSYTTNGKCSSSLGELYENSLWVSGHRRTLTYDSNGNNLTDVWEYWVDSQWVNRDRYTCVYGPQGNILSRLWEIWQDSIWHNATCISFSYDAEGNTVSYSSYLWRDSLWSEDNNQIGMLDGAGNYYYFSGYHFAFAYRGTGPTEAIRPNGALPAQYILWQNYPNPFNPSTTIKYELPKTSHVVLTVYDILGREVSVLVNEKNEAGIHEVKFSAYGGDAAGLASGVYFYRLTAGSPPTSSGPRATSSGYVDTKKLLLIR